MSYVTIYNEAPESIPVLTTHGNPPVAIGGKFENFENENFVQNF